VQFRIKVVMLLAVAAMIGAIFVGQAEAIDKGTWGFSAKAIQSGGNGIYTVYVEDDPASSSCGTWTASTAGSHPAGPGLNVLFGGGFPGTSYTTLRSYSSSTDYGTGSPACTSLCSLVSPTVVPIFNGATVVGFRFTWTFTDGMGPSIDFIQEVVVVGPVDGSETVDNTVVRETHTVTNNGPGTFSFGLRKMWDWQIGSDDGPYFGSCSDPTTACDRSMNLTGDGTLDGLYPDVFVVNEDPATTGCPPGVTPISPDCGGAPLYLVAGTVTATGSLSPAPTPPEVLQFNSWGSLVSDCWYPALVDNTNCAGGDTAQAYFYGLTAGTALTLSAGQSRSFTEYIVAGENGCPAILAPALAVPELSPAKSLALIVLLAGAAVWILHRRFAT
jgi:hypothetical protein